MPEGINLIDLFSTAAGALQQNRKELNKADTYNHNHGDNMVEIFDVITQAMKAKKNADAPTQLEYAAQLLRQKANSGSASAYAQGLAQAAQQVTGKEVSLTGALDLLQTLMNGGKSDGKTAQTTDLLGSLLGGLVGGEDGKVDLGDMLNLGLGMLQDNKDSKGGLDLGNIAKALVSNTEMSKTEHRSESAQVLTNAVLQMLTSSMAKKN